MASREEPMDAENYKGVSTYSNASSQTYEPRWRFEGIERKLVNYFGKDMIEKLNQSKYVNVKDTGDILFVDIAKRDSRSYIEKEFNFLIRLLNSLKKIEVSIPVEIRNDTNAGKRLKTYVTENNLTPGNHCFLHLSSDLSHCILYVKQAFVEKFTKEWKETISGFIQDIKKEACALMPLTYPDKTASTIGTQFCSRSSYAESVRKSPAGSAVKHVTRDNDNPVFTCNGLDVFVVHGSISNADLKVDGIVNAANERLEHIGGVALNIAKAAGKEMTDHCNKIMETKQTITVSNNVVSSAGKMRCKGIIHAVGPKWDDFSDKKKCLHMLAKTVENALTTAENEKWSRLAMPAISAGIYGVPKPLCAAMYIKGIMSFCYHQNRKWLKTLCIVDIHDDILKEVEQASTNWKTDSKSIEPEVLLKHSPVNRFKSTSFPKEATSGAGASVSMHGKNVYHHGIKWTRSPDEHISGLHEKVRCYQTDDRSFSVKMYTGSITKVRNVEAIVCSADSHLSGLGPLSEAVSRAAGYIYKNSFATEKDRFFKYMPLRPGQVFKCVGGDLYPKQVVHIVIEPVQDTNNRHLCRYKENILSGLHSINGWMIKSVAVPLIAGGMVQHCKEDIRKMCDKWYEAVLDFCHDSRSERYLREIIFVNQKAEITQAFIKCFDQHVSYSGWKSNGRTIPNDATRTHVARSSRENQSAAKPGLNQKSVDWNNTGAAGFDKRKGASKSVYVPRRHLQSDIDTCKKSVDDFRLPHRRSSPTPASKNREMSPTKYMSDEEDDLQMEAHFAQTQSTSKNTTKDKCASCQKPLQPNNTSSLPCGHSFCSVPCFIPFQSNTTCTICSEEDIEVLGNDCEEKEDCVICMDTIKSPKKLPCGHVFCSDCINLSLEHKPACPVCGRIFGKLKGNQPEDGTMNVKYGWTSLPGYEGDGTIEIVYTFRNGTQKENHPRPGKPYKGTERRAYLPDNKEGQKVLRLLRKAFESRLTFTIGSSRTTGQDDVVTWNDIHHKTKRDGGTAKFGYPDKTYIARVLDELAAKGIKE